MKILVTGGSGFLGTHLVEYFGADNFSRRNGFDLLNLQDAKRVEDYDIVLHLGALMDKSDESAEEVFLTNVEGSVNILRGMKENAVFIFASTKDVYGRFADNYALVPETCPTLYSGQSALEWSKLIAERYVEFFAHKRNFRACIFRLSTVYGPMSEDNAPTFVTHYADLINKGEPIRLPGKGAPVRDILHVNDLAAACEKFIDSIIRHGLYNLGGGKKNSFSLRELVEKMEEISNLQAVIDETADIAAPFPTNYVSDITLVERELDWSPKISAEDGLRTLFR